MNPHRLGGLAVALAIVAVACGGDAESAAQTPAAGPQTTAEVPAAVSTTPSEDLPAPALGVLPEGPSALENMTDPAFPEPLVDPADVLSGGPPPDGIPSIDDPVFLDVADALELLEPQEAVVAVEIDGDARAYPAQVMIWHEIVNDVVGGVPVAITYCPLCNSAVTYERKVRGVETTFGTSGRLFASALVMYDRATESLWTHFDGRAVIGVLAGDRLEPIASPLMAWADFRSAFPDGRVLDPSATGFVRDYGRNPYVGYDDEESFPFLFRGPLDDRAKAQQRVVGVAIDSGARAYALDAVRAGAAKATNDVIGDEPFVIFWKAGQSTALEDDSIAGGRDVGSVGVFSSVVDDVQLTFVAADGDFVDAETNSTWIVTGEAVEGPLAGSRLERIAHLDTFWFAWATYQPGTELVEASG